MTEAEMLAEAESIACAVDYDSSNDKIRDIARLVRDYAGPLIDALAAMRATFRWPETHDEEVACTQADEALRLAGRLP